MYELPSSESAQAQPKPWQAPFAELTKHSLCFQETLRQLLSGNSLILPAELCGLSTPPLSTEP